MPTKFKALEHPSDVGIIAYGKSQKEIFENAAYGMFSLMADLARAEEKETFKVKVAGDDPESLLVNWLNELIFYEDSKKILLKRSLMGNGNTKIQQFHEN